MDYRKIAAALLLIAHSTICWAQVSLSPINVEIIDQITENVEKTTQVKVSKNLPAGSIEESQFTVNHPMNVGPAFYHLDADQVEAGWTIKSINVGGSWTRSEVPTEVRMVHVEDHCELANLPVRSVPSIQCTDTPKIVIAEDKLSFYLTEPTREPGEFDTTYSNNTGTCIYAIKLERKVQKTTPVFASEPQKTIESVPMNLYRILYKLEQNNFQEIHPAKKIIWVMDTSTSMNGLRAALSNRLPTIITKMLPKDSRYDNRVVNSDGNSLTTFDWNIVSSSSTFSSADQGKKLAQAIQSLSVGSAVEKPLGSIMTYLGQHPDYVQDGDDLHLILFTDEDDASAITVNQFTSGLIQLYPSSNIQFHIFSRKFFNSKYMRIASTGNFQVHHFDLEMGNTNKTFNAQLDQMADRIRLVKPMTQNLRFSLPTTINVHAVKKLTVNDAPEKFEFKASDRMVYSSMLSTPEDNDFEIIASGTAK
jgi:hypothetical protein